MAALGLADALMARAVRISHQRILDHRGRLLSEIDLRRVWKHVGPCVGIRRADLHRILLDGAAGVPIRLSKTVTSVTQTAEKVCVRFDDGRTRFFDLVIGADGINSSIRRLVFGDIQPRHVGQISWRFIAQETYGVTTWTAMLARGRTFLMIPVEADALYCYADLTANGTEPCDRVRERAAHAISPNMAQGASMALEDALILTGELTSGRSPIDALAAFAARRRKRIQWVRQRTHRRDRIRRLPTLLRNLSLRLMGSAIYEADYRPLFDEP